MTRFALAWFCVYALAAALMAQGTVIYVRRAPVGGGVLDDTNLVTRYYIDENDDADCNGATASQINDSSANNFHLTTVAYGSSTMDFSSVSGNCALETTNIAGEHYAYIAISDSSDAIRDIDGGKVYTQELVVDVDSCSSGGGRVHAIQADTSASARFGVVCTSTSAWAFYWEGGIDETWSETSGNRIVLHVVVDTNEATAANRVKVYVDGTLKADGGTPMAEDDTLGMGSGMQWIMLNRNPSGTPQRSITTYLYYSALYDAAFSASRVSDHYDVLTLDDDTP